MTRRTLALLVTLVPRPPHGAARRRRAAGREDPPHRFFYRWAPLLTRECRIAPRPSGKVYAGWVEGQNITVERRYAEGNSDQLPTLATELVRVPVVLIVTSSLPAALAAKKATATIPCGQNIQTNSP
jgi:hypothetical protein